MSEPEQLDLLDWLATQPPRPAPVAPEAASAPAPTSPDPVLLTRVNPSCNMHRFYSVALAVGLFGDYGVVRHWGRIGASGQSRTDWYEEACEADRALQDLLRTKRTKGYRS